MLVKIVKFWQTFAIMAKCIESMKKVKLRFVLFFFMGTIGF